MKAMKAMNAMVIKKTMKAMQTAVSKNPMRKSPAMKAKKAMMKPRKSTAMETILRPAENLQAYVQRALECVISLSRLRGRVYSAAIGGAAACSNHGASAGVANEFNERDANT